MSERKVVAVGEVHTDAIRVVYLCAECECHMGEQTFNHAPDDNGGQTFISHGLCEGCAAKILEEAGVT